MISVSAIYAVISIIVAIIVMILKGYPRSLSRCPC
jgi:hypothetical protein